MKLSTQTLAILKNFHTINPSIAVKAGSVLKTLSPQTNIMAEAKIDETFDKPFAIYDLGQFLGAVSLFSDPEFEFSDSFVKISSDTRAVRYYYADPSMVKAAGDKKVALPSKDVSFKITEKQLAEVLKAAAVLGVPEIAFVSTGAGPIKAVATDTKSKGSNDFAVEVDGESDATFKIIFKPENLKMISGEYLVEVCAKGITRFSKDGIEYFIASESSSEFSK